MTKNPKAETVGGVDPQGGNAEVKKKGRPRKYPKGEEAAPQTASMIKGQSWWESFSQFLEEAITMKGDCPRSASAATQIPHTSFGEIRSGISRLPLEYFLRIAQYGGVRPPVLLDLILQEPGSGKTLEEQFEALPLSEQLRLARGAIGRAEQVARQGRSKNSD